MLIEAGADPNIETAGAATQHCALLSPRSPSQPPHSPPTPPTPTPGYTPPTAGWTALVYACSGAGAAGAVEVARRLLSAG
ncbi:jg479, partial [Pararge aegeria aegeria]